jgi:transcriptional regulator
MNNLASERVRIGMSQAQLSEVLGINPRTLGNWERGNSDIPSSKARKLAVIFGCTVDYLFGLTQERTNQ